MDDLGDSAILKKVEKCRRDLSRWNWNVFRNVRKKKKTITNPSQKGGLD